MPEDVNSVYGDTLEINADVNNSQKQIEALKRQIKALKQCLKEVGIEINGDEVNLEGEVKG